MPRISYVIPDSDVLDVTYIAYQYPKLKVKHGTRNNYVTISQGRNYISFYAFSMGRDATLLNGSPYDYIPQIIETIFMIEMRPITMTREAVDPFVKYLSEVNNRNGRWC